MKYIEVNGPEYRGAKMPQFDPLKVNESEFEDGERYKEYDIEVNEGDKVVKVDWLTQESESYSKRFINELRRALRANGVAEDCKIYLRYAIRDDGLPDNAELIPWED